MSSEFETITLALNVSQTRDDDAPETRHDGPSLNIASLLALSCVTLLGIVGNLLILVAIAFSKRLQKRSNIFVANLAVCDLLICVYIMPLALMTSHWDANTTLNSVFCRINGFIAVTCCYASVQTCMLIAVERYFHICRAVIHRKLFVPQYIACVTVGVWIYALVWSVQGFSGWTRYWYSPHARLCTLDFTHSTSYNIAVVIVVISIPVIAILFCYLNIFCLVFRKRLVMKNHRQSLGKRQQEQSALKREYYRALKQARKGQRETNVAFMLMIIIVLFIALWTPAACVIAVNRFVHISSLVFSICAWLALSNSAANSLVYGLLNRNFRNVYVAMFRKLFCCKETHDDRAGWELSNFRARDQINSSLNVSQAMYRCGSPSSVGLGFLAVDNTSQSRLTDSADVLQHTQQRDTQTSLTKYGKYLDVPSPNTSKLKPTVFNDVDFTSGYETQRTLEFSSSGNVPVIHIAACTPSDDVGEQWDGLLSATEDKPRPKTTALELPATSDTLSL